MSGGGAPIQQVNPAAQYTFASQPQADASSIAGIGNISSGNFGGVTGDNLGSAAFTNPFGVSNPAAAAFNLGNFLPQAAQSQSPQNAAASQGAQTFGSSGAPMWSVAPASGSDGGYYSSMYDTAENTTMNQINPATGQPNWVSQANQPNQESGGYQPQWFGSLTPAQQQGYESTGVNSSTGTGANYTVSGDQVITPGGGNASLGGGAFGNSGASSGQSGGFQNPAAAAFQQLAPSIGQLGIQQAADAYGVAGLISNPTEMNIPGVAGSFLNESQNPQFAADASEALNQGFDPQNALYNRTLQQVQDQTRAGLEARGVDSSPYGAGVEGMASENFNIDWQNTQAQREASAASTAQSLYGSQAGLATEGMNLESQFNSSMLEGLGAEQGGLASEIGALQGIQSGAAQEYAQPQTVVNDYLNYLGRATSQNQASIAGTSANNSAILQNQQLQNQSQAQTLSGLGSLGGGLMGLAGK